MYTEKGVFFCLLDIPDEGFGNKRSKDDADDDIDNLLFAERETEFIFKTNLEAALGAHLFAYHLTVFVMRIFSDMLGIRDYKNA